MGADAERAVIRRGASAWRVGVAWRVGGARRRGASAGYASVRLTRRCGPREGCIECCIEDCSSLLAAVAWVLGRGVGGSEGVVLPLRGSAS